MSAFYLLFHCFGELELWSMQKWREPGIAIVNKMTPEMLYEVKQVHPQLVHFGDQEH